MQIRKGGVLYFWPRLSDLCVVGVETERERERRDEVRAGHWRSGERSRKRSDRQ